MQQAIAILDSGVGGLTVAKEVINQLPHEKIIYFGDTARAPYGPRSEQEVRLFTKQVVDYLLLMNPKIIVIACNTATAVALDTIRSLVQVPVIGVIEPGARAAIKKTKTGIVGVIGTEGTIKSNAYEKALKNMSDRIDVHSRACPLFVPLVEKGLYSSDKARDTVRVSLAYFRHVPIDCLILGCTHYPFLSPVISEILGNRIELINSAEETAQEIKTVLEGHNMLAETSVTPSHQFFCSGDTEMFSRIAGQWLGFPIQVTSVLWNVDQQII